MEILIEILVYLLVVLGMITVCCSIFNKFSLIDPMLYSEEITYTKKENYLRNKGENQKVSMNLRVKGLDEKTKEEILYAIENGNYFNIYDVVDKIQMFDNDKK
ncbi:MAG: hypothetical protein PHR25_00295 [Clostridia bacterium]|nr:hypothetical protein [Clostridia bacterium]MDD4375214.1 hypothetical protein [Clostridia bacterium]